MQVLALGIALAFVIVGCGSESDCRHKDMQCADGFTCEEQAAGRWVCVESESKKVEHESKRPQTHAAEKAPTESRMGSTCPEHRLCVAEASDCVCDSRGRLVSRSLDKNGDGEPDEKATYEHDREGRPVEVLVDVGIDGTNDKRHVYEYDERGNPLVWEVTGVHGGVAAGESSRITYRYDREGSLIATEFDEGMDDKVDKRCVYDPPCPPPIPNPSCKKTCK